MCVCACVRACVCVRVYIQNITMCPHGYHHNGFMATPALGTQDVRLHIVGKDCIVESPQFTFHMYSGITSGRVLDGELLYKDSRS